VIWKYNLINSAVDRRRAELWQVKPGVIRLTFNNDKTQTVEIIHFITGRTNDMS